MQKYVPYLFGLFLVACITACGSGGTTAATPVAVYNHPATLATPNAHMGGAVQGGAISAKFSNYSVSTWVGIAENAGFSNYSTTNGPPALFNHPNDITFDSKGNNFYVADFGNNAIRKITPSGTVTTLQCTDAATGIIPIGFNRPSGITTDGTNIYVVDAGSNSIRVIEIATNKVTIIGSASGLAGSVDSTDNTAVLFNQPTGITTDGVNLYVTDYNNGTVRWIDTNNNYAVYTLAGTSGASGSTDGIQGAASFNRPGRITTDGVNLFLTDFGNRTIRKIDILTGIVTTLAGSPGPLGTDVGTADGIGTAARFNQPDGITTDGTNLYVTDLFQNTIRKVVISTGAVSTISGIPKFNVDNTLGQGGSVDSPGTPSFYSPIGITTDGTSLFVADTNNNTIRKIK